VVTKRKLPDGRVEVKRIVTEGGDPRVRETVCTCEAPGETAKACSTVAGLVMLCRCLCHRGAAPRR
jgi:hypothetical protein